MPHHLLDVVEPDQVFSAAEYSRQARTALAGIAERGRLAVVAGGTGLYLRALLHGLFEGPSRDRVHEWTGEGAWSTERVRSDRRIPDTNAEPKVLRRRPRRRGGTG